ncbi:MAG: TIGR00730 family Rossman fold protein [Chloroflexota bacterium]|nr:TIGR00730 family Rossman fold protein [Chloroflexota bacterium]
MDIAEDKKDVSADVVPGVEPLEPRSVRTSPTRQRVRRRTGSGDRDLDEQVRAVVERTGAADADLLEDIVETAFRIGRTANRGEMKLISRSLRELGRAFRVFAPYRGIRKVSIFGSARTTEDHAEYAATREFSRAMAERGWMVITGAGPGIMAAGHEGAGAKQSFGVGIKLPIEQGANGFIAGDPKLIDFKYFFTRKITFMKESDAFVLLPGGYGTLDEGFELLTLMQTGKTAIRPVVLLQPAGSTYWTEWMSFVRVHLVERQLASPEDLSLIELANSVEEAVATIERFYSNYHSARYVGERLILRLRQIPDRTALARLNADFRDVLAHGRIEPVGVTPAEAKDGDCIDMHRLALYPTTNFGRIRELIDALNNLG